MIRRIRSWIGIGVIGALVAGVAAFSVSDRRGDDAASTGQVPAPSGIVVGLSLLGPAVDLVAADVPTVLVAQVVGAAPVAAVELWADGEVVDRVVPDDAYTTFVARLRWTPPAGTHLLSARALGADAAVGVSNVLDLAATDAVSTEILGDGQPAPAPAPGATIRRAGRALGVSAPLAPTPDLPPLPPGLADLGNVSVAVTVKDCDATVDVTGAESGGLTLRRVDGSAPAVATADPTQTSGGARLQEPLGPGLHQYLAEQTTHGVRRVVGIGTASTPDDCGGTWTGDVRLTGGVLATTDGDTAEAYLYLSTQPGRWQRVPSEPQSAVPRTPAGFDFGPYLPVLDGRRLEVVAWGRSGGEVHELGRGTFTPAPGLPLGSTVGKTRAVDLVWIKTPASAGKPEVVAATGYVSKPGILSFRWSTTLPYVTHAVWQVFEGYPPGGSAQVQPPGVVLSGTTQGSAGVFPIDFSKIGKVFIDDQPNATVSAKPVAPEPGYGNLSAGQGVPQSAIGAPIVP
ncbi:MAG: hypothetical protein OEW85_15820, partial [Acidimicrobiia bacterium]|nr:hypothetical protein [Acidimicrobiia bacterium]